MAGQATAGGTWCCLRNTSRCSPLIGFRRGQPSGAETECYKRHNPIWPELEKVLKDHGVLNYSLFLHAETRQLFGYAELESEE